MTAPDKSTDDGSVVTIRLSGRAKRVVEEIRVLGQYRSIAEAIKHALGDD